MIEQVKLRFGNYRRPATLEYKDGRIFITIGYSKSFVDEVRSMQGARWHGYDEPTPRKIWSITDSPRNRFQLAFLQEQNPYARYDREIGDLKFYRDVYKHQQAMVRHGLAHRYCIFGCEPGTGKSLAAIEILERMNLLDEEAWYIGPKSGVMAVNLELQKWQSKVHPRMITYEELVKVMKNWKNGTPAPKAVVFDECSKLKTPTSQRSQAALALADAVRAEWGDAGLVLLMSGTPAPKAPTDWWNQCEVACPGFIKEGDIHKFKKRLCLIEERQSISGGVYPHIVTWLDDSKKCAKCGKFANEPEHNEMDGGHRFEQSTNEVEYLYKRLKGLVLVQFKADCLDLPEKQYRIVNLTPTVEMLRAAKLIKTGAARVIEALTRLRELSDGFQYHEVESGKSTCPTCKGAGHYVAKVPKEAVDVTAPQQISESDFVEQDIPCDNCGGVGTIPTYTRSTDVVGTPKDQAFTEYLDDYEDIGRFIVWGGFTGTVDRLCELARQQCWTVLRVDGRGYHGFAADGGLIDPNELLIAMDYSHPRRTDLLEKYPKLCFVGHPQAGGMALTLTASPIELFYSNCFDGTARMQAEDRFHRAGMDKNRGALIVDFILLPTDQLVLDNLKKKKRLQDLSMGQLEEALEGKGA